MSKTKTKPVATPKSKKPSKIDYPLSKGKKLDKAPTDWDPAKHKPLKRSMFNCVSIWMDWRADQLSKQAESLRAEAQAIRTSGGQEQRHAVKRLQQVVNRADELRKQLIEQGFDPEALLADLN